MATMHTHPNPDQSTAPFDPITTAGHTILVHGNLALGAGTGHDGTQTSVFTHGQHIAVVTHTTGSKDYTLTEVGATIAPDTFLVAQRTPSSPEWQLTVHTPDGQAWPISPNLHPGEYAAAIAKLTDG